MAKPKDGISCGPSMTSSNLISIGFSKNGVRECLNGTGKLVSGTLPPGALRAQNLHFNFMIIANQLIHTF